MPLKNIKKSKAVSEVVKDLGIYITLNLSWSMQANKCANKANSVLGFIRRAVVPKNPECFRNFIRVWYVRYSSTVLQVWCPHLKKGSHTLEKVQRRAAFKCGLGNIGPDMSYKERPKFLKWPTLQQRRSFLSLRPSSFFSPFTVVRPTLIFGIFDDVTT